MTLPPFAPKPLAIQSINKPKSKAKQYTIYTALVAIGGLLAPLISSYIDHLTDKDANDRKVETRRMDIEATRQDKIIEQNNQILVSLTEAKTLLQIYGDKIDKLQAGQAINDKRLDERTGWMGEINSRVSILEKKMGLSSYSTFEVTAGQ